MENLEQTKLTIVKRNIGNGFFYMKDNWLKRGDIVFNTRNGWIHEIESDSHTLICISDSKYINEGDRLQHLFMAY